MKAQLLRKSAIKFFEEKTGKTYDDLPEGKQMLSSTLAIKLMYDFMKSRIPWYKRIFTFALFLALLSCKCLPQIPTQVLYTDDQCQAVLPNYTALIQVRDNCEGAYMVQSPSAGYILDAGSPYVNVTIVAHDQQDNTQVIHFDVVMLDTLPPSMDLPDDMMSYSWTDRHHLLSTWQHDTENKLKALDPDFSQVINSSYIMLNMSTDHRYWAVYQPKDTHWIPADSTFKAYNCAENKFIP